MGQHFRFLVGETDIGRPYEEIITRAFNGYLYEEFISELCSRIRTTQLQNRENFDALRKALLQFAVEGDTPEEKRIYSFIIADIMGIGYDGSSSWDPREDLAHRFSGIYGHSLITTEFLDIIHTIAQLDINGLLTGEDYLYFYLTFHARKRRDYHVEKIMPSNYYINNLLFRLGLGFGIIQLPGDTSSTRREEWIGLVDNLCKIDNSLFEKFRRENTFTDAYTVEARGFKSLIELLPKGDNHSELRTALGRTADDANYWRSYRYESSIIQAVSSGCFALYFSQENIDGQKLYETIINLCKDKIGTWHIAYQLHRARWGVYNSYLEPLSLEPGSNTVPKEHDLTCLDALDDSINNLLTGFITSEGKLSSQCLSYLKLGRLYQERHIAKIVRKILRKYHIEDDQAKLFIFSLLRVYPQYLDKILASQELPFSNLGDKEKVILCIDGFLGFVELVAEEYNAKRSCGSFTEHEFLASMSTRLDECLEMYKELGGEVFTKLLGNAPLRAFVRVYAKRAGSGRQRLKALATQIPHENLYFFLEYEGDLKGAFDEGCSMRCFINMMYIPYLILMATSVAVSQPWMHFLVIPFVQAIIIGLWLRSVENFWENLLPLIGCTLISLYLGFSSIASPIVMLLSFSVAAYLTENPFHYYLPQVYSDAIQNQMDFTYSIMHMNLVYFAFSTLGAVPAMIVLGGCYIGTSYLSSYLEARQEYLPWTKFIKEEQSQLGYASLASLVFGLSALGVPSSLACIPICLAFGVFVVYGHAFNETPVWKSWVDNIFSSYNIGELLGIS